MSEREGEGEKGRESRETNAEPRRLRRKDLVALPILFSRTFSPSLAKLLIPSFSNYMGSPPVAHPRRHAHSFSFSLSSPLRPTLSLALFLFLSLSALCKRKYSIRTLNSITAFLINPKYLLPKEGRPPFLLPRLFLPSDELDLFQLSPSLS